jgi:CRISPR-associated endonuclease/helicase Cas3
MLEYYAHSKEGKEETEWQRLIDHLLNTAKLAKEFGQDAGVSEWAYLAALFHDLGKYSTEFQMRLRGKKVRVDHSTAGAKELIRTLAGTRFEPIAKLLSYCITGHHAGLLDHGDPTDLPGDGTLVARLKTDVCDYQAYQSQLKIDLSSLPKNINIRSTKNRIGFSLSFWTRMVYSALVDADFQETQTYMIGEQGRGQYDDLITLLNKLRRYLQRYENPETEINRKRTQTLLACIEKSKLPPGFFRLTVPTGGGKTLASMAFALNHVVHNNLRRVIYIIPYTTIIEQNAQIFKNIFGEENVLEHHCHFDWEDLKNRESDDWQEQTTSVYQKLKLAAENWDIPIIVTTNVQFFESLFANRSSRCRKLHNIAKSVLIFDEAQMLPREYFYPCLAAVWELVVNYGATALFCTATQPGIERFLPDNVDAIELASHPEELFSFYRRVEIKHLGVVQDDELCEKILSYQQALCVVNTRRHASGLFNMLEGDGNFHLSTLMCAAHRKEKLSTIRKRLSEGQSCRVISTTVMEAGVDLDFPVGFRAMAGLDSINQAAGRVNRNMHRSLSQLFVFEPQSIFIKRNPKYITQAVEIARQVFAKHQQEPISVQAIKDYFDQLYSLQDPQSYDYKGILKCFEDDNGRFFFETAARLFRIIEDPTESIIIPYDEEANKLIEELKHTPYPLSILRKLQPYTVSIYKNEFEKLSVKGVVIAIADAYPVLDPNALGEYYSPHTGLLIPDPSEGEGLFF